MSKLAKTETLKHQLGRLAIPNSTKIDLIDIPQAKLAMKAEIANEGILLAGENTLSWSHF